jgi:hypothetical protein
VLSSAGYVPFPTLMRIVSAHIIPYDVHEYFVFQKISNFNVGNDVKTVNVHLKLSLRAGVKNKSLKQSKGTGASGSFKIGEVVKPKKNLLLIVLIRNR